MGKIKKSIILPKNSIVLFFFFLLVFLGNKTPIYEKQTGEGSLLNRDDAKIEIIDKENVTKPSAESFEWTVEKVDEHLTKIKLPPDDHMSTEDELFDAMNSYRRAQGVEKVSKNDTICRIAHVRAEEQNSNGELDGHAGFDKYVQEQNEFGVMGEVLFGGSQPQSGVHIVEFGWDRSLTGHREAIRDPQWNYGCGGVVGYFAVFVFGKK
ncbi:MAG: CAP domain-containing protein [Candidatus Levybacteria bacterium]|nr:CAP domain-containing protein [Candidatus Levybacteria bacterium]